MNNKYDFMAKYAVDNWLRIRGTYFGTQLLPGETAAVLVMGRKVTGNIADAVRYAKGLEDARRFLVDE